MRIRSGSWAPFALLALAWPAACSPTKPTPDVTPPPPPRPPAPLTVSRVSPTAGWPLYYTEINGSGFQPGVRATFDGLDTGAYFLNSGILQFAAPWHEPGVVDVVVTNPDGSSVTLTGGFTYKAATLELSKSVAAPGETLTVTWSGPHDPSDFSPPDIIGLYAIDEGLGPAVWSTASGIGERFSRQFAAPLKPAMYEFRYHMMSQYLLATAPLTVR